MTEVCKSFRKLMKEFKEKLEYTNDKHYSRIKGLEEAFKTSGNKVMKRIGDSEIKFINLEYAYKQHLRIACEQREKSRKRIEALEHDFKKVMAIKVVELDEAIKLQTCLMGEAFVERPKEPKIYGKSPIHSIKEDIEEFERIRKEPFTLKGKEIKIGWDFADGNKEDEDFYYKSDVDKVAEEICNNIEAKGVMSVDEKFIDADDVIEIVQRILGVKE